MSNYNDNSFLSLIDTMRKEQLEAIQTASSLISLKILKDKGLCKDIVKTIEDCVDKEYLEWLNVYFNGVLTDSEIVEVDSLSGIIKLKDDAPEGNYSLKFNSQVELDKKKTKKAKYKQSSLENIHSRPKKNIKLNPLIRF